MQRPLPGRGAALWIRHERWRVEAASRDHDVVHLEVVADDRRRTFLLPFDRLHASTSLGRPRRVGTRRAIGRLRGRLARRSSVRAPLALLDARVDLLPHQLEPLAAILDGARRVLIADDVGLGKTIEAGAVIAELLRRRGALRTLIVVPASLRTQWARELWDRFGLPSRVIDRDAWPDTRTDDAQGDVLWTRGPVHIASVDYVKQPHVLRTLPLAPWDIVVIDEAHDVCGASDRHDACAEVARRGRHVLLLTATPHSGDEARFHRLTTLGALPGIEDALTIFRRTRADLSLRRDACVRWHRVQLSRAERDVLDALAGYERAVLTAAGRHGTDAAVLLLSVFRKRALSTMAALDATVARRLAALDRTDSDVRADWRQPGFDFLDNRDELSDEESQRLTTSIGMPRAQERAWLGRLRRLSTLAASNDSKVARLSDLITRRVEPVVVFTEFRTSLSALERRLAGVRPVTAVHGGQSPHERSARLDAFLRGTASVLIATDVASQGLNLQAHARWVVNLELPWNPIRLRQRIGRVDRIGQTRRVHATMLIARHRAEDGALARLAARALAVRQALGDSPAGDVTLPSEDQVARVLIAGAPLPTPTRQAGTRTTRWRNRARAAARCLTIRRKVAAGWRARERTGTRPWLATRPDRPASADERDRVLAIVTMAIVDSDGGEVERHLIGVVLPWHPPGDLVRLLRSDAVQPALARRLRKRLTRVRHWLIARTERAIDVERALVGHLADQVTPGLVQTALFDREAAHHFEAALVTRRLLADDMNAYIERLNRQAHLCLSGPSVEVILCRRS